MALYEKPFTQIVEDVMAEMNERSTESLVEAKYKRRVNDIYMRDSDDTLSYVLFQDTYALATDFGIPTTEPGFYYDISQGRQKLEWYDDGKWYQRFTTQASTYPTAWRECPNRSSIGLFQVEISPPGTTNMLLNYAYIKALPEMIDFT